MTMFNRRKMICIAVPLVTCLSLSVYAFAQKDAGATTPPLPLKPRVPSGLLTDPLGTYVTIEGMLFDGVGKVESNSLLVDTVNGSKLEKPVLVVVKHVRLPSKKRCILKGYELGEMIGRPPAEYSAYQELGHDPEELVRRDAIPFQWRPYFVPLIAVEPQGLEVTTTWGIPKP